MRRVKKQRRGKPKKRGTHVHTHTHIYITLTTTKKNSIIIMYGENGGGAGFGRQTFPGFGAGRRMALSVLMWVVLGLTMINWIVLLIFFFVSQSERTVTISWYLSPYWWVHLYASGVYTAAVIDSVQSVPFIFKPSVASTIMMAVATIVDIVGGYFYIIDYWGKCIFSESSLTSLQKIGCNDERLYVWVTWTGAWLCILFAFLAFVLSLWDSAVKLVRSRQFGVISGGFNIAERQSRRLAGGLAAGLGSQFRPRSSRMKEQQTDESLLGESLIEENPPESLYNGGRSSSSSSTPGVPRNIGNPPSMTSSAASMIMQQQQQQQRLRNVASRKLAAQNAASKATQRMGGMQSYAPGVFT